MMPQTLVDRGRIEHSYPVLHGVRSRLRSLSEGVARIALRRRLCITIIGLLGFCGSTAVGLMVGVPQPSVTDEFSYLLAADTFAHGRITNPTHPLWMHFESSHTIHRPTYMSKYPPAQGVVLAIGQMTTGYPIVGVWLSVGLMCAAICGMLYAWVPPRWALLGGFLTVVHPGFGITGYWAQSYWGGAVAATGGALVAGELRRMLHEPRAGKAILFAIGLLILANSRPYEGLLVSLPAMSFLAGWMLTKNGPPASDSIKFIIVPIVAIVALAGAVMASYNLRIVGNALRMPYMVHERTYMTAPIFLLQSPSPEPVYHHRIIRERRRADLDAYNQQRSIRGFLSWKAGVLRQLWGFYVGRWLSLPLLVMAPLLVMWTCRSRWLLFGVVTGGVLLGGFLATAAVLNHYAAPITALTLFFVLQAMRLWRRRDRTVGSFVAALVVAFCLYSLARTTDEAMRRDWSSESSHRRAAVMERLYKEDGLHLVIVRYGPGPITPQMETWVHNEADIDSARVVWAHDMGEARNRELTDYFKNRRVWYLNADDGGRMPVIDPYAKLNE
jgi:hypothetical protein